MPGSALRGKLPLENLLVVAPYIPASVALIYVPIYLSSPYITPKEPLRSLIIRVPPFVPWGLHAKSFDQLVLSKAAFQQGAFEGW